MKTIIHIRIGDAEPVLYDTLDPETKEKVCAGLRDQAFAAIGYEVVTDAGQGQEAVN